MSDFSTLVTWGQHRLSLVAVAIFRCSELRVEKLSEELLGEKKKTAPHEVQHSPYGGPERKVTEEMLAKSQVLTLNLLFSLCCRKYATPKIMATSTGQNQSGMLPF